MLISLLMRIIHLVTKPGFLAVVFLIILASWMLQGQAILKPASFADRAAKNKRELIASDPKAAAIFARIDDEREKQALLVASYSASADGRRRSVLADMAAETASTGKLPYRARLAALALNNSKLTDPEEREAFLVSYATFCEDLSMNQNWGTINDFLGLLEQAEKDPNVWPLVNDDPLALSLWSQLNNDDADLKLLEFYHRNRDWLGDPLASLDLSGPDNEWNVRSALTQLFKNENTLKIAVTKGKLGVYALSVMLTHGNLINNCYTRYKLDPSEVIPVIMMNHDMFGEHEGDARWIGEKASWLTNIRQRHPTVWFAAGRTPLALQLLRDAPQVADSLLDKYGADEIAVLIYHNFTDSDQIAAAASAIDKFGDIAIYVYTRYDDKKFMNQLGKILVDKEVGIRAIPFVMRFGDNAFDRIKNNPKWVDRYYNEDGSPRADSLEWIEYIPGGAAMQVARNWSKGYPNEWSELGWAAVDVADIALTIASLGSSEMADVVAKAAKGAAKGDEAVKGARLAREANWTKELAEFRAGKTAVEEVEPLTRMGKLSETVMSASKMLGKPIWGTVKLAAVPVKISSKGIKRTLEAWKAISPAKRKLIYRGLLATGLFVTLTERTFPHHEEIANGLADSVGSLIGNAAKDVFTMAGDALVSAVKAAITNQLPKGSDWVRRLIYWAMAGILLLPLLFFLRRAARGQRQIVVAKV